MNKKQFFQNKKKKNLYSRAVWVCASTTNYVKMFVGAVARDMGVKMHLTLILEAEAMHRKRQQECE